MRSPQPSLLGAVPVATFEFSLGIYLVVRDFRACRITSGPLGSAAALTDRTL